MVSGHSSSTEYLEIGTARGLAGIRFFSVLHVLHFRTIFSGWGMTTANPSSAMWFKKASVRYAASAFSGLLLFACFPLVNWNILVWVACFPLLMALIAERRWLQGFFLGYVAGAVFLSGSCYWFVSVMQGYGNLNPVVAAGILLLFV